MPSQPRAAESSNDRGTQVMNENELEFCNVENRAYPRSQFVPYEETLVHVLGDNMNCDPKLELKAHTLDGYPAVAKCKDGKPVIIRIEGPGISTPLFIQAPQRRTT